MRIPAEASVGQIFLCLLILQNLGGKIWEDYKIVVFIDFAPQQLQFIKQNMSEIQQRSTIGCFDLLILFEFFFFAF